MIQNIINTIFKPNRKKVSNIIFDIKLFYKYVQQNEYAIDTWYFNNIFTIEYWHYLHNYSWLNNKEKVFLHQGILSMILFMSYQYQKLENGENKLNWNEIQRAVIQFQDDNLYSTKLQCLVKNALLLQKNKTSSSHNNESTNELVKSISWTLNNIILPKKQQ